MILERSRAGHFPPGISERECSGVVIMVHVFVRWRRRSSGGRSVVIHEGFVGGMDAVSRTWVVGTAALRGFLENVVGSMGLRLVHSTNGCSRETDSSGIRRWERWKKGEQPVFDGVRTGMFSVCLVGMLMGVIEVAGSMILSVVVGLSLRNARWKKGHVKEGGIPTPESVPERMPRAVPNPTESSCSLGAQKSVFRKNCLFSRIFIFTVN